MVYSYSKQKGSKVEGCTFNDLPTDQEGKNTHTYYTTLLIRIDNILLKHFLYRSEIKCRVLINVRIAMNDQNEQQGPRQEEQNVSNPNDGDINVEIQELDHVENEEEDQIPSTSSTTTDNIEPGKSRTKRIRQFPIIVKF